MSSLSKRREVTLLRPAGTGLVDWMEMEAGENRDYSEVAAIEQVDERIDLIRDAIAEIANQHSISLKIREHQLMEKLHIPSRKDSRLIFQSNLVVALDPKVEVLAYVLWCLRANPVMSALLSYVDRGDEDESLEIFSTQTIPLADGSDPNLSRIFVTTGKPRELDERKVMNITEKALLYPEAA